LPIQGDGRETRAFCFVDDAVDGIVAMYERGDHRQVYHIGTDEEVSILALVDRLGSLMGHELLPIPSLAAGGGTLRRCPDITKMRALGYEPKVELDEGLSRTIDWYLAHREPRTGNELL